MDSRASHMLPSGPALGSTGSVSTRQIWRINMPNWPHPVWSVLIGLGRSLTDLLTFLTDLHAKGVDLFLHQQGLDTSTPSGRAMFQMFGVFAEFERAMIRERVMTGLACARAEGKQLGRRKVEQSHGGKVKAAPKLRSRGIGIRRIAREVGLGVGTVIRLVGNENAARPS